MTAGRATVLMAGAVLTLGGGATAPARPGPVPIGTGAGYRVAAASRAVVRAEPIGALRCARTPSGGAAHVEVFVDGLVVVLPPGIGVAPPAPREGARVSGGRCVYPASTREPTGLVDVAAGTRPTLGDLFAIWGQPLAPTRLLGFRGQVSAWVGGVRWRGDVRAIPLARHAQIVVELGRFIPPHARYVFPPGR